MEELFVFARNMMLILGIPFRTEARMPLVFEEKDLEVAGVYRCYMVTPSKNHVAVADIQQKHVIVHEFVHALQMHDRKYMEEDVKYGFRPYEVEARFIEFCYKTGFKDVRTGDHLRWRDLEMGFGYKPSRSLRLRINKFKSLM